MRKRSLLISIIFVIFVICMAFLAWRAWPQQEVTEPAQNHIDVSGWKTYRNRWYGYEIKYPSNWYVDTTYSESDFTRRGPVENSEFIGGDTIWSNYQNPNQYNAGTIPPDFQSVFLFIYKIDAETTLDDLQKDPYIIKKEYMNIDGVNGMKILVRNRENPDEILIFIKFKVHEKIFSFSHGRGSIESANILDKMVKNLKLTR